MTTDPFGEIIEYNAPLYIYLLCITTGRESYTHVIFSTKEKCTANVYRELQGLYREIGMQGFQIYGDCMYTLNPCNFEIPHSYFHCSICREFDFTGILQGFPALDVGKLCNYLTFLKYPCKICRDNL